MFENKQKEGTLLSRAHAAITRGEKWQESKKKKKEKEKERKKAGIPPSKLQTSLPPPPPCILNLIHPPR